MIDVFIARQPIFTANKKVFAYELLFRDAKSQSRYQEIDGNKATAQVLVHSLLEFGFSDLTGRKPAFINFPADVLMESFMDQLPAEFIVLEILEDVQPTPEIVSRCKALKEAGFRIALDDFVFSPEQQPLVELANYIKIDFRATSREERRDIIENLQRPGLTFLAEKVESYEEYRGAVAMGYHLLQGYFFCKPEILSGKTMSSDKKNIVLFLQELTKCDFDYHVLEDLLRHNISLTYKLLRLINSPYLGFRTQITSLKQALTLIGQENLYKWISLLFLSSIKRGQCSELVYMALLRARFCELAALRLKDSNVNMFFLGGMFSLMDAFLNRPMEDIVIDLPLNEDVKEGMLGLPNSIGLVLQLIAACERGNFERADMFALSLGLSSAHVMEDYYQAGLWARRFLELLHVKE